MSYRQLFAFLVLTLAPLVLLGRFAYQNVVDREIQSRQEFKRLIEVQTLGFRDDCVDALNAVAQEIQRELARFRSPEELLVFGRTHPWAEEVFWVSRKGQLLLPPDSGQSGSPQSQRHQRFLQLIRSLDQFDLGNDSTQRIVNEAGQSASDGVVLQTDSGLKGFTPAESQFNRSDEELQSGGKDWATWYDGPGAQIVLWNRYSNGDRSGVLLSRARWMAELLSVLPDQSSTTKLQLGETQLLNESNLPVYRWGRLHDSNQAASEDNVRSALVRVEMPSPLAAWSLAFFPDPNSATLQSDSWIRLLPQLASLAILAVIVLGCGGYVFSSTLRQIKFAKQQVSFLGQVSHELRTPLTNIRLHAELAQRDVGQFSIDQSLPEGFEKIRERLEIVESESDRLGRLIGSILGVMKFGKPQPVRLQPIVLNEVVDTVLSRFEPALTNAGIEIKKHLHASEKVLIDSDLVEQILTNLLHNVEKYAASGKQVMVAAELKQPHAILRVRDFGPGIPKSRINRVFKAFVRLDSRITSPSGLGLGLTIARAAAERHGGELIASPQSPGIEFVCKIPVTPAPASAS